MEKYQYFILIFSPLAFLFNAAALVLVIVWLNDDIVKQAKFGVAFCGLSFFFYLLPIIGWMITTQKRDNMNCCRFLICHIILVLIVMIQYIPTLIFSLNVLNHADTVTCDWVKTDPIFDEYSPDVYAGGAACLGIGISIMILCFIGCIIHIACQRHVLGFFCFCCVPNNGDTETVTETQAQTNILLNRFDIAISVINNSNNL